MSGNEALQEEVILKYFDIGPFGGRGSVVRNMLLAYDVQFEERKIAPDASWSEEKARLISSDECPIGTLPVLYIGGKPYFGHIPIVRYLATKFGAMTTDPEVRYGSEVMVDEYVNWRRVWVELLYSEEKKQEYLEKREQYYPLIEKLYAKRADPSTPYFMGLEKPGYDDIAVYSMMYDDKKISGKSDMEDYPTLKALFEKIQTIPRVAQWAQEVASKPRPFT